MKSFPNQATVQRLRNQFPVGCRIVVDEIDDPYTRIPPGTQGTCMGVDDAGSVMAIYDCGSSLSALYQIDSVHRVSSEDEIRESLNWLGKRQREKTGGGHCPRCGIALESFDRQALSRYADITVCSSCGGLESLECAGLVKQKPFKDWWCVRDWKL